MKFFTPLVVIMSLFIFSGCVPTIHQPSSEVRSLQIREAVSQIQTSLQEVDVRIKKSGLKLKNAELITSMKLEKSVSGGLNIWVLKHTSKINDTNSDTIKITLIPPPESTSKRAIVPINKALTNAIVDAIEGTSGVNNTTYPLSVKELIVTINLTSIYTNSSSIGTPKMELVPSASLEGGVFSSKTSGMTLSIIFER